MENSNPEIAEPRLPAEEVMLVTSQAEGCVVCPHLKHAWFQIVQLARRRRLPGGLRHALAVAEPHGRATLQRQPAAAARSECTHIRVITANLWHDFPRFREQVARLERFALLVEESRADILLLQEVTRRPGLYADAWLAERLGMAYVYARANGHQEIGFEEGLAVMSRFPIEETPWLHRLSQGCNPFVRRLLLGAAISTSCGSLLAFSIHLGLPPRQNAKQLANLETWMDRIPLNVPLVVGGDFNASEKSLRIQQISRSLMDTYRELHSQGDAHTHQFTAPFGLRWLRRRLDYIFLRSGNPPWQVTYAEHLEHPSGSHSDHQSVLVHLSPAGA